MTPRETILAALHARLSTLPATALRGDVLPEANGGRGWRLIAVLLIGLVILFAAGHLIVTGAKGVARTMGIGEFVIGAVIVAVTRRVAAVPATTSSRAVTRASASVSASWSTRSRSIRASSHASTPGRPK